MMLIDSLIVKMVTEEQAIVVMSCFTLVWFWRRRAQRCSAARARDAAARRRTAAFHRLQEYELALVTSITVWWPLLVGVRQRWSLWKSPRCQFFNDVSWMR